MTHDQLNAIIRIAHRTVRVVKRTPWTEEQIADFRAWHEETIQKHDLAVQGEFRNARETFIGGCK